MFAQVDKVFWVDFILIKGEYSLRAFIERDKNDYHLLQHIYL